MTARSQDTNPNGRYREWQSGSRPSYMIFEIFGIENARARNISALVTDGKMTEAETKAKESGLLQTVSELMQHSNMPIVISANDKEQLVASKNGSDLFSIEALSDGERNAFLIAANVLLARPGAMILIDEPERHLHRSIMSPFLMQLLAKRQDCAFVISTHDLEVPDQYPSACGVLVRECIVNGEQVSAWNVDIIEPIDKIDETIRIAILGSRKKVLFIEGTSSSLDTPLYSIILPGVTVQGKGGCRDVISHVRTISAARDLHWVKGFGVVDRDQLSEEEVKALKDEGVFAISCYSVEGIYYQLGIQQLVAEAFCRISEDNPAPRLASAKEAALSAMKEHRSRLVRRMVERVVRHRIQSSCPSWKSLKDPIEVRIDVPSLLAEEEVKFDTMAKADDLDGFIRRYPIRETPLIPNIVERLQLKSRGQYEAIALRLIRDDSRALEFVKQSLDGALEAISAA